MKKMILFAVVFFFLMIDKTMAIDINSCGTLNTPGGTYYLTQDISSSSGDCLSVTASGITLDCQGHTITTTNQNNGNGISVSGSNTVITNCRIVNFYNGIYTRTSGNLIYNNFFKNQINVDSGSGNSFNTNKKLAFNKDGLVAYWRFDEGTATLVHDESANGNTGSIQPEMIHDFNDGNINGWGPSCGGEDYSMVSPGYEGAYSVKINSGCYARPFPAVAGRGISFACRGSGWGCRIAIWDGSNFISSGDGSDWKMGDGNWHIYTTHVDATNSGASMYMYSNSGGGWSEYDFINFGPVWANGIYGKALSFDGVDDYAQAVGNSLPTGGSSRTVSMWFKAYTMPSGNYILTAYGAQSPNDAFYFVILGSSQKLCLGNWGGGDAPCTSTTLSGDTWYHVAATFDGTTAKIYLNGVEEGNAVRSFSTTPSSFYFTDYYPGHYFKGIIDEVKVYSRALTADEISQEHQKGTSGKNIMDGTWLGGNYWSDYTGQDTDSDGIGNTYLPYNNHINGGDYLPLMCMSDAKCDNHNECTTYGCSSGLCSFPAKPDETSCSGDPGKCCSGICDNNGISGSSYYPECRTGPYCIGGGNWGYAIANQGNKCGGPFNPNCYSPLTCQGNYSYYKCNSGQCSGVPPLQVPDNSACNGRDCGTCCRCLSGARTPDLSQSNDCASYNIPGVATCTNTPDDGNPFTWDLRNPFISQCLGVDYCSQGSLIITHNCDQPTCGAPCVTRQHCSNKCSDKKLYTVYNCNSDCTCYLQNPSCVVGYCGAECGSNGNCQNKCVGDVRYYSGSCDLVSTCSCSWTTEDCNLQDGWYNTTSYQWIDLDQCNEKEQVWQEYRDYTCNAASCTYTVTQNRWYNTGQTRNKADGTSCDDGLYCTNPDTCTAGVCGGSARDCSANNLPEIATCNNNPDNNPFTFDYASAFTSTCDEVNDKCTTGSQTLTHSCADADSIDNYPIIPVGNGARTCTAKCDQNSDCASGICNSDCICAPLACTGPISLTFNPNPINPNSTVTATVSGLSNCDERTVVISDVFCVYQYGTKYTCKVSGTGCFNDTVRAPIKGGYYTYYACLDMNQNSNYEYGEYATKVLSVTCKTSGQSCTNSNECCGVYTCYAGICKPSGGGGFKTPIMIT